MVASRQNHICISHVALAIYLGHSINFLFISNSLLKSFLFLICYREAATCQRSQQCMALKVGPTSRMACFTPLFICWFPSLTFLPSLPPVRLGVLPSPHIHPNLASQHVSHLFSSNQMFLCALLVLFLAASCLDAHAMSLI